VIGHPQIAASKDSPGSPLTASRGVLHGMPARVASSVHERARLAAATARGAGYVPRPLDAPRHRERAADHGARDVTDRQRTLYPITFRSVT
jgi:hypothetical protein